MSDAPTEDAPTKPADWTAAMEAATEDDGYFHSLGARHWAFFADQGTTLLVSFESAQAIRARPDNMPLAQATAARHGWSHLCLIADGQTWYRDTAVYRYFDRLVDDAFFEDFDRVLFYGHGHGGHAACHVHCGDPAPALGRRP